MEKSNLYFPSSTGKDIIHVMMWEPEGEVKGIVQISHGMIEHIGRYDRFAKFMTKKGFVVIGNDHLGHGETAAGVNYGYFAPKDGSFYMVRDLRRVNCYVRKKYPKVPIFLVGHSMGSFVARRYVMVYGRELTGLILLGTGEKPDHLLKLGKKLIDFFSLFRSERVHSWTLEKLCFLKYDSHFRPLRTPSDWLSRDEDEVDAYRSDGYCQFAFTLNGYRTLFEVIAYVQKKKNIRKVPQKLPILLLSGDEDPVGSYGRSVKAVARAYQKVGVQDVTLHLYPKARHELLHELEYQQTHEDILKWILRRCH